MCIGIPMQVIDSISDTYANCQNNGVYKTINMQLVGPQITGTWILVFIDAAREVLSESRAKDICAALEALSLATNDVNSKTFSDLINREPINPFLNDEK